MFINCPYCRTLVSTDPVTDLPPTHCPHCRSLLRRDATVEDEADTEGDGAPRDFVEFDLVALMNTPAIETETKAVADTAVATGAETPVDTALEPVRDDTAVGSAPEPAEEEATDAVVALMATAAATAAAPGKRGSRTMPSFARVATAATKGPRERWILAVVVVLAVLLILQLLLADRARLSADARWRPTLNALCAALFCDLPPWREPTAFTLLQRDVRQHPNIPGALRVSATFRNDARWSQPWPRLRLTLSDANGRPAGERDFRAEDYLGGPASQPQLASGESATVAMDILEPATQIVGYDFGFR